MKKLFIILSLSIFSLCTFAQEKLTADAGLTFTSRHYWRGIPVSSAPCFEGSLSVSKGGFTLGYWGGYAFDNTYSEFDIYGSYTIGGLTLSFIDLYVNSDETDLANFHPKQKYGEFDREKTSHLIDLSASYSFGESFPLTLSYSTMVWGNDRDANGDQRFSNYLEAKYPIELSNASLNVFCGATLNDKSAAYADAAGLVNVGVATTRTINVTESFKIPVTATVAFNPQKEAGFLILAIGL